MIIEEINFKRFELQFAKPFRTAAQLINSKEGFYIFVISSEGSAYGEISPLLGLSRESPQDAEKLFAKIKEVLIQKRIDNIEQINTLLSKFKNFPSVLFGVEQALFSLLLKSERNTYSINNSTGVIGISGLISSENPAECITEIERMTAAGFKAVKIKVGINSVQSDVGLIKNIRDQFGYGFNLRLDANLAWTESQASEFLKDSDKYRIEFIEDPVSGRSELLKLSGESNTKIFPDIFIKSPEDAVYFLKQCSIEGIVIKPVLLGFVNSLRIIDAANQIGKSVVISSVFENIIGRRGLIFLSAQVQNNNIHGLGTHEFLAKDFEDNIFPISNGVIEFNLQNYLNNLDIL